MFPSLLPTAKTRIPSQRTLSEPFASPGRNVCWTQWHICNKRPGLYGMEGVWGGEGIYGILTRRCWIVNFFLSPFYPMISLYINRQEIPFTKNEMIIEQKKKRELAHDNFCRLWEARAAHFSAHFSAHFCPLFLMQIEIMKFYVQSLKRRKSSFGLQRKKCLVWLALSLVEKVLSFLD